MFPPLRHAFLVSCFVAAFCTPVWAGAVTPNDTARLLAGMAPAPGSPLARLTRDRAWAYHARTLDQAWKRLDNRQLKPIRAWSKDHVPGHRELMLYMFSGPDFLYADAFFPNATTYVLSALEPVGPIPDLTRLSAAARARELQDLRGSLQTVLSYSFFITKQMKTELRDGQLRGTLPLLYVFLARAGKTVHEVRLVRLEPDGQVRPRQGRAPKFSSDGVRIVFSDRSGGERRTLYYFQTDLSNGGLKVTGFTKFIEGFGPSDSLIKSASYLLHGGWFSAARKLLLRRSAVLIQDDSGIPLRHFDRSQWELRPYGKYLGPIDIFAQHYQRDMQALFGRGRAQAIEFGIGYKWRRNQSNVLLAVKKGGTRAAAGPDEKKQ